MVTWAHAPKAHIIFIKELEKLISMRSREKKEKLIKEKKYSNNYALFRSKGNWENKKAALTD